MKYNVYLKNSDGETTTFKSDMNNGDGFLLSYTDMKDGAYCCITKAKSGAIVSEWQVFGGRLCRIM